MNDGETPGQILPALLAVMRDVTEVGKGDYNAQQGFRFRGIDAVLNAVAPAFREHGVIPVPKVISTSYNPVEIGVNRTAMGHAQVQVCYSFYAVDGSHVDAVVPGEAMDVGDKAVSKAMSVAFRTALIQVLNLPTGEADPDANSYERSSRAVQETRRPQPQAKKEPPTAAKLTEWDDQLWTVQPGLLTAVYRDIWEANAADIAAPGKTGTLRQELVQRLASETVAADTHDTLRELWQIAGKHCGVADDPLGDKQGTLRELITEVGVQLTEQQKQEKLAAAAATDNGQQLTATASGSWAAEEAGQEL